jgi:membrane-associated protein
MPQFMSSLLDSLLAFTLLYKYWGLFGTAFVSSLILPIPASTLLTAAGGFASQGFLNIYSVLVVTLLGSILGDVTGFLIARRYGDELLHIIGFRRLMHARIYKETEGYIRDFAPSLVFLSRFLTEVSPAVNILAGLSEVPFRTFFIFASAGETTYVLLYGAAGYFLGSQWENNLFFLVKGGLVLLTLGLSVSLLQIYVYRKNKNTD